MLVGLLCRPLLPRFSNMKLKQQLIPVVLVKNDGNTGLNPDRNMERLLRVKSIGFGAVLNSAIMLLLIFAVCHFDSAVVACFIPTPFDSKTSTADLNKQSSSNWLIRTSNRFRTENLLYFSTTSSLSAPCPVVVLTNPDTQKLDILRDNKNKSGVYH